MKNLLKNAIAFLLLTSLIGGCKKQEEWLEIKSQRSFIVPETLSDFQALLDNYSRMKNRLPISGIAGTDNLFLTESAYSRLSQVQRNLFTWQKLVWVNQTSVDWEYSYTIIEYANVVIDGITKLKGVSDADKNYVLGQALFLRSFVYYHLVQLFCKPYNAASATQDLGLPLRMTSNVNVIYKRSTVAETYSRIIDDAKTAATLLPSFSNMVRASQPAAYALLSKAYLVTGNYPEADSYAGQALTQFSVLLDYNSDVVNKKSTYRFPASGRGNPEIIYYSEGTGYSIATPSTGSPSFADTTLFAQYENNDLRKDVLYNLDAATGYRKFRGGYTGSNLVFAGLATNELYLIKAECTARRSDFSASLGYLNQLLVKRYKSGTFVPLVAGTTPDVLRTILSERRKEFPFTANIRWEDLRRLNQDQRFAVTITRKIGSTQFTLQPNDNRYVLPIPENETQISGIEQNER